MSSSTTVSARRQKVRRSSVAFWAVAQTIKANGDGGMPGEPNGDQSDGLTVRGACFAVAGCGGAYWSIAGDRYRHRGAFRERVRISST